eukprot:GHUV01029489.1.p1 GENE.GHUV01029489.1~~GHUV01029489.1.p1  ORF type:complete len:135 (+),score=13.84 GHUV01029489.1:373-777(+)
MALAVDDLRSHVLHCANEAVGPAGKQHISEHLLITVCSIPQGIGVPVFAASSTYPGGEKDNQYTYNLWNATAVPALYCVGAGSYLLLNYEQCKGADKPATYLLSLSMLPFASPKSVSLMCPSLSSSTFSGFRSR